MIETWPDYIRDMKIHASSLACRRGGRVVFKGVTFEISAGDYLCLRGRNGAGKSTLLRLLAGFVPASSGELSLIATREERLLSDHVMMVGHMNGLKPVLSLRENAAIFHKLMTGRSVPDSVLQHAAEVFDLTHLLDEPVQYFSSGQRHRSALMRLNLVPRQVWLMDEPTVGLDQQNRAALAQMMQAHLRCGGMIISATHDPIDVEGKDLNLDDFAPKATLFEEVW